MRIPSDDVPQADKLSEVVRTVEAVAAGAKTFDDISHAIGKVDRQGRYYRRAAEILGLVSNVRGRNQASLTSAGQQFVAASSADREKILAGAVIKSRIIERVIPFLESKGSRGVSRHELEQFIEAVTESVGPSMIGRRVSTITSWLDSIRMLRERNGRYQLTTLPVSVPIVEYEASDEPLFPKKHDLVTYQQVAERAKKAGGYLSVLIDEASRDRANGAHRMLTNLVAAKIQTAGAIPKRNKYIDLSTVWNESLYLFEMKSTRDVNAHHQVRTAISQLYEYRYLQQAPTAKLVVVIENPLPDQERWLVEYVVKDRGLFIAWDGDRRTLRYPSELVGELRFLS